MKLLSESLSQPNIKDPEHGCSYSTNQPTNKETNITLTVFSLCTQHRQHNGVKTDKTNRQIVFVPIVVVKSDNKHTRACPAPQIAD